MRNVTELEQIARVSGEVIATNISYDNFLYSLEAERVEWVNGLVIKMPSIDEKHDAISIFLVILFNAYLAITGGRVLQDPMIMRLAKEKRGRAPDVIVLLPDKLHLVEQKQVNGAADLVVEIVSEDSQRRDRIEKFGEYERGGVPEYWILDPIHKESLFYVLNEQGIYERISPDKNGNYRSTVLDKLQIPADIFWRDPLPNALQIPAMVEAMFKE